MHIELLKTGDVLTSSCVITARDVQTFGELVGDLASHHLASAGDKMIAHGLHVVSLVTRVGASHNFIARRLSSEFVGAARVGDCLTAQVRVKTVMPAGQLGAIVDADYSISNQHQVIIVTGTVSGISTGGG